MKERYTVNPFPELALTDVDRVSLEDLANTYIMSNLDLCMKFMSSGRKVDPRRWKPLKERKGLRIYSERPDSIGLATPDEATGAGLPTILCVGTKEGKLDDLMFGIISEDLETMRLKASYADSFSAAAVLDGVVMPSLEDPFRSLVVKWMELDIPFNSTGLIKNRDYIYLEGIGIVKNAAGERLGYSLLHSVNFPQTHTLPNRVRGNISFIAYWRQVNDNTMEMYATGIIDPVDDGLIRKLVLPVVATLFLGSLEYVYCGLMRKLSYMLERRYAESKSRGAPNKSSTCVTCTSPVGGRRLGDFGKTHRTCKLCFGYVCSACKIVRKLSFVDPDLQMTQRKVIFCAACYKVTGMSAMDIARAKLLGMKNHEGTNSSGLTGYSSSSNLSDLSYSSNQY
ncbi:hypothetical protein PHYSODRAFT_254175 [Phytophthora sojae]|uniref:FYVE-type domain-containing protein n=1 Tax=Phytophthora sojae (strain P6497) TaxID=1094619 RepID=G5A907_PHYSP|nr:hypothetical protein PHYSODRAFT_254175 [Phytophthora sojae]EGZ08383.1 hypothetical protein PHYSODRAFT_254175 [Phytophthora sojae]|eukprot:XP_009536555.1 hypothetical protein PHYSODRAFT_254175 [Phytophthora sojae]